jgi:2-polyprenyl-3-methyl-5-hydroxy-6-metoxy-1,4-benzoquinol methylase
LQPILEQIDQNKILGEISKTDDYSKIIIDKRAVDKDFFDNFLRGKNVIAIDEGGAVRSQFPYLIDILPLPERFSEPNIRSISFLNLPEIQPRERNGRILVSFGGEDPGGLTEKLCNLLSKDHKDLISRISIVLGPLYKGREPESIFHVIRNPSDFLSLLAEYSGLICSFGITAFEANHLGTPVLLMNPGEYHEELGKLSGFYSAGLQEISTIAISSFISGPEKTSLIPVEKGETSLSDFINNLADLKISCPVCSSSIYKVKARFKWRTYHCCDSCGMIYMLNYNKNKVVYNKEYFFDQYENQYGKTYLDDFDHLSHLADERLDLIGKCSSRIESILDVGCAYGPFLKKSSERGFIPFGTDISDDAVNYVRNQLNLRAVCSQFQDFVIPEEWCIEQFHALTMWYVIEHFSELSRILVKVNSLLKVGGIFAFSTPSGRGISARNDEKTFLLHSPDDHFTIWDPEKSRTVLDLFGFRIVKKRITGHHPERFNSLLSKSKAGCMVLMKISRLFQYGDTFEIYAEKVREL